MSSVDSTKTNLEDLPDEIFLLICRYLSSTDVLYSFYGLNNRLSQMISGYFGHVVIGEISSNKFEYLCKSILPKIGSNIYSLVVSNQWKGILSIFFTNYFGEKMSSIFGNLRQITLKSFSDYSLKLFLENLQNLRELNEIFIFDLCQKSTNSIELQTLLDKIFTANNNQLDSILFNDDSIAFSIENQNPSKLYPNIKKLSIDLKTMNDLHRLLTLLPELVSINVSINEESLENEKSNENRLIGSLKQFKLQTFGSSWNFDDLSSVLKRLPNLEELSISIETNYDTRLTDGQKMFSLLSNLSLKKFNYFLRYYESTYSLDQTNQILSTWQQFSQEFLCIRSIDEKILVLYTLPFTFSYLILPSSLANNQTFIEHYASQVKSLTLYEVSTEIIETFTIMKKCHQIQNLTLRIDEDIISNFSKKVNINKLPYLTKITVLRESTINAEHFQRLIEIAPNLHHLEINYEFLRPLLDIESISLLLKHRITHVYMLITKKTNLDLVISSISSFISIFPNLRHLFFNFKGNNQTADLLILTVLNNLSYWKSLISFGVVDAILTEDILLKDLRQWVGDNSTLNEQNSFVVDYTDQRFRLWL